MRVLKTEGSERDDWVPCLRTHRGQPYAILSHRWLEDSNHEVLFVDIEEIDEWLGVAASSERKATKNAQYAGVLPSSKPGFSKLRGAARQALLDGYQYIWIDTCCIDKNSSSELSEAINSMWAWYGASNICYAYLADVSDHNADTSNSSLYASQWWERGWTLQELLAPQQLRFFSSTWTAIGDKKDMDTMISEISGINPNVINGTVLLESVSIAQRMSWASCRTTTRVEDMAYSLMGIFNVNMPLLYGEGERAFLRLQQEIMKDSDDETIFAWRDETFEPHIYSGLLATRPSAFASSGKTVRYEDAEHRAPYSMTNKGLSITLRLSNPHVGEPYMALLHCANPEIGAGHVAIYLVKVSETSEQYARIQCREWASFEIGAFDEPKTIYVKQSFDQQPAHPDLGKPHSSIRLLRVVPAEDASIVRVRLMEADIDTSIYTAVSYVGGPAEQPLNTILANSEQIQVTENVLRFLQKARRKLTDELFWVYSICIKENDPLEKGHQAAIMQRIFGHATKVIVWLSKVLVDPTRLQLLIPERMRQMGGRISDTDAAPAYEDHDDKFTQSLEAFTDIAAHSYWKRLWHVQEIVSARDVTVELESFEMDIKVLAQMYDGALFGAKQRHLQVTDAFSFMGRLLEFYQYEREPQLLRFGNLLTTFQFYECADPRDRVYALVTISDLAKTLEIDYTKTAIEVFFNIVTCLSNDRTLAILPILLQALRLRIEDWPFLLPSVTKEYEFEQMAYSIMTNDVQSGRSLAGQCLNASAIDRDEYLTVEPNAESPGGLLFKGIVETRNSVRGTRYRPSELYVRNNSGQCSFMGLPLRFQVALMHTYGELEESADSLPRLRIITDAEGLVALGFCISSASHVLPQVFEHQTGV